MPTLRMKIRGRVQGVWYRGSTQLEAQKLGLVGWVRNRMDGSVEAVAVGDAEALNALRRWCGEGPSHARVDAIEAQWSDEDEIFEGFEVVR